MKLFKFDPKKPVESFNWHINVLKLCGHWSQKPKNEKNTNFLYELYSWIMITFFHRPSIGSCFICIIVWSVTLFLPGSTKYCIVPAVFPFNFESGFGFYLVWIYQVIGTCYSAILYPTFDNLVNGVIFHATAQINRLGYHLSRIGYDEKRNLNFIVVQERRKSKNLSNNEKLIECIEHYQEIVAVGKGDIRASASVFPYLITIVFQVWQLCYAGNELTHALVIKINAKIIFEIPLETSTFISTMRASYSYFSVMKSVVDK
uniref:CSON014717 protein n=1 Tax=Culicoides sonorensis TaxID=179676 RepID=A0A336MCL2_CULSO